MESLVGWAGLILGFSGLIFVHELGHFLLAKWHGVRVHVFSLGMGPYLFSYTWRGTVYVLSLIPLGGYVKMMGQDDMNPNAPPSKDKSDYRNKRPGQKADILAAGAIFNLIFAFLIFTLCYWHGMFVPPPRLGTFAPDEPLAKAVLDPQSAGRPANLEPGDRILSVNGVPVKTFLEAALQIAGASRGEDLYLHIERLTPLVIVTAQHDKAFGASSIGLNKHIETKKLPLGFTTESQMIIAAEPDKKKPAAHAGLVKGDIILSVADQSAPGGAVSKEIRQAEDFINIVRGSEGRTLTLMIQRDGKEIRVDIAAAKSEESGTYQIGIAPGMLQRVLKVDERSPAYPAGLRAGSVVLGFKPEDRDAQDWSQGTLYWKDTWGAQQVHETKMKVPGENLPVFAQRHDCIEWLQAENGSLSVALGMAWDDSVRYSSSVFTILRGLFNGNVSSKSLSGPLGIGAGIFHVARDQSFLNYLWLLGFISLNLGIFQFLPIPLLDGFHLVMTLIEKLKGSPVSMKAQEVCQYAGLFLVGALMILAFYNDIARFIK